jgi:hypothetical protein
VSTHADSSAAALDAPPSGDRLAELRASVARLRVGAARGDHSHTLMLLGGIIAPLGLVAVLLGWYGASHTPNSFEQVPYLISGGLLGLGFVFLGGFLYFTHWITVLVREGRAQADRTADTLERIEVLLAQQSSAAPAPARTVEVAPVEAVAAVDAEEPFYATPNGSMVHRRDCPVIANRENPRVVARGTPGFTPCRICDPY